MIEYERPEVTKKSQVYVGVAHDVPWGIDPDVTDATTPVTRITMVAPNTVTTSPLLIEAGYLVNVVVGVTAKRMTVCLYVQDRHGGLYLARPYGGLPSHWDHVGWYNKFLPSVIVRPSAHLAGVVRYRRPEVFEVPLVERPRVVLTQMHGLGDAESLKRYMELIVDISPGDY